MMKRTVALGTNIKKKHLQLLAKRKTSTNRRHITEMK